MSSFRRTINDSAPSPANLQFQNLLKAPGTPNRAPLLHSSNSHVNLTGNLSRNSSAAELPVDSYASSSNGRPRSDSMSYDEQVSLLNSPNSSNIDYKAISKHLGTPDETLKMQGGDVARYLSHQIENSKANDPRDKRRTRSLSFSALMDQRRESTASGINVPGGFRREFIINKSLQQNKSPPNFVTRNFMEFLTMYGHFAGEDFDDDDDDDSSSSRYEDVFDEESQLMHERGVPGLPKKRKRAPPKGTAGSVKTFFLLFKALVGSGVLFLPGAFRNGGLLFSTIVLSLFGVLTFMCYIVLIKSKKVFGKSSFGELGYTTYGSPLKYSIMVSIIISQVGFVATYILFTMENLSSFLLSVLNVRVNEATVVAAQCVLLIPLVLIRNLAKLSFTSFTLSLFILVGLVIVFYFSGLQLFDHGLGPNITQFNGTTWSMLIGVAVTAFEGVGLILPIESTMAHPEKFPFVLFWSMVVITTLFVSIGVIGYSAFGENVKSIIILNLPQSNVAVQLIMVLYSLAVFLTAPLQLFPAIRIAESAIFNSSLFLTREEQKSTGEEGKLYHNSGKYNPQIKWMKNALRAVWVVLISILAYLNRDNFDKFVSFNGCFACIPLVYIYPPMIHLKTYKSHTGFAWLKFFDYVLIVVGILAVVYTTYEILFAID